MRLKCKHWRVEISRKNTRHKLETRWPRGVFVVVRVKTIERIVMGETGTYVVQSVRRVAEEQRYDHRLLLSVRGAPWQPNSGDVSTDLPEPMLIIPPKTFHSDNRGTCNVHIGKTDAQPWKFTAQDCQCLGRDTP